MIPSAAQEGTSEPANATPQGVDRIVAIQLALDRRGLSCGSIDGIVGSQTRAAVREFQRLEGLPTTGEPDVATVERLAPPDRLYVDYVVTSDDLNRLMPVPGSWFGKSTRERLDFESLLEEVSEKAHAHPNLVRRLNPQVDWARVVPGTCLRIPDPTLPRPRGHAASIRIRLAEKSLSVYGDDSRLLAFFPCSIARSVEKRPIGVLTVAKLALNPNYRFDPDIFVESVEARRLGRRLTIPPGPNNPVGTAWIGLDRPGYGIHGTAEPEKVGRTESHGCFRLSNWNAEYLLGRVWVGMPVYIQP